MRTDDWEKALNEVLDTDAVPTKSLDEFVAACTAEHPGRWSSLVEWLSAPKRAVASTVAGSLLLTAILMLAVLVPGVKPPTDRPHLIFSSPQVQIAMSMTHKGDWENGF